jgi:hypothetical protein
MATEIGRHRLYETIKEAWGEDNAAELMSYLPPVGWADVATKHDLRAEVALLRSELHNDLTELRSGLRDEMAELRGEMNGMRVDVERRFTHQLRWIVGTMIGMTAVFSTIVTLAG